MKGLIAAAFSTCGLRLGQPPRLDQELHSSVAMRVQSALMQSASVQSQADPVQAKIDPSVRIHPAAMRGAVADFMPAPLEDPTVLDEAALAESGSEVSAATRKMRMLRALVCGNKHERAARAAGALVIAGVDEVGRGALFGCVVAAAVILPADCRIRGLRDSKQLLPADRERLALIVRRKAIAIAIEEVDAETIDRVNIYQATRIAMTAAARRLDPAADHLLIDAMRLDLGCRQTSLIYGDSLSISIAAASVVAKVYRDRTMCELHEKYPQYGLNSHKGYSTPEHIAALLRHGPCALHRRTFRPVALSSLPWDRPDC